MHRMLKTFLPIIIPVIIMSIVLISIFGWPHKVKNVHPVPIVWGRNVCVRCGMSIVDKQTASEIGNPITKKVYKFDSPGCAVLWLYHDHHFKWAQKAKFWIMDAKTGKWINMKTAHWYKIPKELTPMAFGLAATDENVKDSFDFREAKAIIFKEEKKFEKSILYLNKYILNENTKRHLLKKLKKRTTK